MFDKIQKIIANKTIQIVFQPIVDVQTQQVLGYEALTRGPQQSEFYAPEFLFGCANQVGLLSELEIVCRQQAINKFAQLQLAGKLFLNISPLVLLDQRHPQGKTVAMVEQAGLTCSQIVIEVTEKYPYPNGDLLYNTLAKYRDFGFAVAIDDLGAGYSGLQQWCTLEPNIVKIDRYFISHCEQQPTKQAFLRQLFTLGRATGALVIAEGIETMAEYRTLLALGMRYGQGYLFARPQLQPSKSVLWQQTQQRLSVV